MGQQEVAHQAGREEQAFPPHQGSRCQAVESGGDGGEGQHNALASYRRHDCAFFIRLGKGLVYLEETHTC